jgi:hypothetical protein
MNISPQPPYIFFPVHNLQTESKEGFYKRLRRFEATVALSRQVNAGVSIS